MATEQMIQQELQDYLDGLCTPAKATEIEQKLASDPAWQMEWEALTQLDAWLKSPQHLMEPSVRFTKNVMEAIDGKTIAKPASAYLNSSIFYAIAGLLGVSLLAIFGMAISQLDWHFETASNTAFQLPSFRWDALYSSTALQVAIMANIILAFILVEKAVSKRNREKHAQ